MKRASGSHAPVALLNERGLVLVAVLWVFMVFFVIALSFSSTVREEGLTAHRFAQESEDYYLALAGFQHGLYELLRPSSLPPRAGAVLSTSLWEESCRQGNMGEGGYRVCVADEAGRVNLNRVDEQTLGRIFLHLGVEESLRSVLVDSIMDWRDNDDLHRLNGAENDYYLSLSPPYTARNGPFEAVEDLLWVRGVTPELFYGSAEEIGLNAVFSVDSPMDRVNLGTAPAEVCVALLGVPLQQCQRFVEERKKLSQKTVADLLGLLGIASGDERQRQFILVNPSVVTLKSEGFHDPSGGSLRVKGVVRLLGGARGFELLRWVDRDWRVFSWKPE